MTEVEIDGITYTIKGFDPFLASYFTLLADLTKKTPKDFEDARKIEEEMTKTIKYVLKKLVTPEPREEHIAKLYFKVMEILSKEAREITELASFPTEV